VCRFTYLLLLFLVIGCPKTMRFSPAPHLTPEIVLQNLANEGQGRYQVSGTFMARSTGIKRLLGSVELDVVAKFPAFLHISVRSFFNQPARIFASNEQKMYLLEMLDAGTAKYRVEPLSDRTVEEILSLPLSPKEIVEVLLGIAPVQDAKVLEVKLDHVGKLYTVTLRNLDSKVTEITARVLDHVITRRVQYDATGHKIYEVVYGDFSLISGINFSHRLDFTVSLKNKSYSVILKGESICFNGERFDDAIFQIDPP
jgi:Domain of unknown function (DUF4292)